MSQKRYVLHYNIYTEGYIMWASWAIFCTAVAQSDINEDLHAAELKYTVSNVF